MSPDKFTEKSSTSWISRLGGSIKSIFFGLLLFLGSMILMWYNEGRAVKTAKGLKEGGAEVVTVSSTAVDPANNGKLVHVSGRLTTNDVLLDDQFGIKVNALKLKRNVEMFQWREITTTSTKEKLGGGEETVKSYSYEKEWSGNLNKSTSFKVQVGHENPLSIPYAGFTRTASNVTLGKFKIPEGMMNSVSSFFEYSFDSIPNNKDSLRVHSDGVKTFIYNGTGTMSEPNIGDIRISYDIVAPNDYSLIAKQYNNTFETYTASNGTSIQMLQAGNRSAESMFQSALKGNKALTWILRFVAIFMMFFGLKTIFSPLQVISDLIPIVNAIVGLGISLASFLVTLALSCVVISVAWIFYRPILGISLLVVAGGIMYYFMRKRKAAKASLENTDEATT